MTSWGRPCSRCAWRFGPLLAIALLTACALPPETGVSDLLERRAERHLLAGLRAYDEAHYADAERELGKALDAGLLSARDRANAHKHRAFVYCTSQRLAACADAFRAARAADPDFALTRAEAGHPLWGPVYRRVAAQ